MIIIIPTIPHSIVHIIVTPHGITTHHVVTIRIHIIIHHIQFFLIPVIIRTILPFVIMSRKSTGIVIFPLLRWVWWSHVVVVGIVIGSYSSTAGIAAAAVNVH